MTGILMIIMLMRTGILMMIMPKRTMLMMVNVPRHLIGARRAAYAEKTEQCAAGLFPPPTSRERLQALRRLQQFDHLSPYPHPHPILENKLSQCPLPPNLPLPSVQSYLIWPATIKTVQVALFTNRRIERLSWVVFTTRENTRSKKKQVKT